MKIIQAGIGNMGDHWLQVVQASTEVEHAGFVEVNQEAIDYQVENAGIDPDLVFATLGESLDAVDAADAVLIVTPPALHRLMSEVAMERGIPVLSEKPLADTLENAQAIVDKANETGVLHMVTQNYRYNPQAQTVKQVLASGELGAVGAVSVKFYKSLIRYGFHQQLTYPLLLDMTIHHFDMMRFFLDADPLSIFGRSWNPAWSWFNGDASTALILDFPDDVVVAYDGSWVATGMETPWNANWRFECEKGVLTLQDDEVFIQRKTDTIAFPEGYRQYLNEVVEPVPLVEVEYERQGYLLHEFYEAVTLGKSPVTTCQDNIISYQMVWDAIESFVTGETVRRPGDQA